ncbi:MAG: 4-(cytidine 5'-diphospho)-2-C-methyl-D-erythritol kinase [Candidatus Zhuqueibacterota bacterium]
MMKEIHVSACAKINLGLRIVSKREDGYHNIETVFQQIDLCDDITITTLSDSGVKVHSSDPQIPQNENNICAKAAKLLGLSYGIGSGVEIYIEKRIPMGAGLGGGSSDAAAVLKGLAQLWNLNIPENEMVSLARQVGADVPFFLKGGSALATGIGDELTPLNLATNYYCLLVYPNIEISSTWAYSNYNFNLTKTKKSIKLPHLFSNDWDIFKLKSTGCNDFEELVFQRFPELSDIKTTLYQVGAFFACMSGSGSTVFGLFDSEEKTQEVRSTNFKHYQVFFTKPMTLQNRL